MDRNKDHGASPVSDRILDRKIESKALPSGFSSNLGRKAPAGDKAGPGKSVKAIVDWLEKTSVPAWETPETRTQEGQDEGQHADSFSLSSDTTWQDLQQPARQDNAIASPLFLPKTPPTHPEEYSLTLLGYKSYFNNRPLARCLDIQEGKGTTPAAKSTFTAASASSCYSLQKVESIMPTPHKMTNGVEAGSPYSLCLPGMKPESPFEEGGRSYIDFEIEPCSGHDIAGVQTISGANIVLRDPANVKAF